MSSLSVSCLDNHVSVVDDFEVSVLVHSRDDMEWSLNIESEFFIELALGWFSLPLVNIDNVPLLMHFSILGLIALDMSSFVIS